MQEKGEEVDQPDGPNEPNNENIWQILPCLLIYLSWTQEKKNYIPDVLNCGIPPTFVEKELTYIT